MKKLNRGIIQVYTGDGKGKTTAALGQTMRVLGWDKRVCWVQFIKGNAEIGEIKFRTKLPSRLKNKFIVRQFHHTSKYAIGRPTNIHKKAALAAWKFAKKIIAGKDKLFDLIVLDELNNAIEYNLLEINDVLSVLQAKSPALELVITGRSAHPKLIKIADLVTEMKKKKHPYDNGFLARKGVEY